jgi:hypothetical protein
MKNIIFAVALLLGGTFLYAQTPAPTDNTATPQQEMVPVFDNQVLIPKEYSKEVIEVKQLDNFDAAEEWAVNMPREQGLVQKKKIVAKAKMDDSASQYCLGMKCKPYLRGYNWIEFKPPQPVLIPGTTKAISLLVMGRNLRHNLVAWVQDYLGVDYRIVMGPMNFEGWRRVATRIPSYVKQYSRYIPSYRPLKLTKFVVEFDADEFPESYYLYVDRFEAAVDTFKATTDDELLDEMGHEKWDLQTAITNK